MDLSIPGGRSPGVDLRSESIGDTAVAIWLGDTKFGRFLAGMLKNQDSEAVFNHIFKFLKKCHRQIGGIKV